MALVVGEGVGKIVPLADAPVGSDPQDTRLILIELSDDIVSQAVPATEVAPVGNETLQRPAPF